MTPAERRRFTALQRHLSHVTALLDDVFDCVPVFTPLDKEFMVLERQVFRAVDRTKELLASDVVQHVDPAALKR